MDPTTLVTFLFRAPAEARTVELLGSWDNFAQPYRMHDDRRRGIWSGIFRFDNITFDGDGVKWTKPRSGGLRQGATYWYYYRINSYDDTYDDRQPSTLSCPLIPGQVVNVLDVPIEILELPTTRCSSSDIEGSLSNWQQSQTLDPATKYAMLDPPPVSKIHARSFSDGTLKGRLEHQRLSILEEAVSPPTTPDVQYSNSASLDRKDSRHVISRDSSIYSRGTSSSTAVSFYEESRQDLYSSHHSIVPVQTLYELPEVDGASISSALERQRIGTAPVANAELLTAAEQPESPNAKAYNRMRKLSALSIGPFSVQNIQFYNESRPGTMLNEDPEQHRPRVYSLPTSELRSSEEGSPQMSPMTRPITNQSQKEHPVLDNDVAEFDLGSPSFSVATASTDGGERSPLHLSPQNSIKRPTRSASRGGGAFAGFANRLRSIRNRQRPPFSPSEAEGPPRLTLPSFINYALPDAVDSSHSLAKSRSNVSNQTRSAHEHMSAPTVFDAELPVPSLFSEEVEGSMADAIFSELGYLSASIA